MWVWKMRCINFPCYCREATALIYECFACSWMMLLTKKLKRFSPRRWILCKSLRYENLDHETWKRLNQSGRTGRKTVRKGRDKKKIYSSETQRWVKTRWEDRHGGAAGRDKRRKWGWRDICFMSDRLQADSRVQRQKEWMRTWQRRHWNRLTLS